MVAVADGMTSQEIEGHMKTTTGIGGTTEVLRSLEETEDGIEAGMIVINETATMHLFADGDHLLQELATAEVVRVVVAIGTPEASAEGTMIAMIFSVVEVGLLPVDAVQWSHNRLAASWLHLLRRRRKSLRLALL